MNSLVISQATSNEILNESSDVMPPTGPTATHCSRNSRYDTYLAPVLVHLGVVGARDKNSLPIRHEHTRHDDTTTRRHVARCRNVEARSVGGRPFHPLLVLDHEVHVYERLRQ